MDRFEKFFFVFCVCLFVLFVTTVITDVCCCNRSMDEYDREEPPPPEGEDPPTCLCLVADLVDICNAQCFACGGATHLGKSCSLAKSVHRPDVSGPPSKNVQRCASCDGATDCVQSGLAAPHIGRYIGGKKHQGSKCKARLCAKCGCFADTSITEEQLTNWILALGVNSFFSDGAINKCVYCTTNRDIVDVHGVRRDTIDMPMAADEGWRTMRSFDATVQSGRPIGGPKSDWASAVRGAELLYIIVPAVDADEKQ